MGSLKQATIRPVALILSSASQLALPKGSYVAGEIRCPGEIGLTRDGYTTTTSLIGHRVGFDYNADQHARPSAVAMLKQ